MNIDQPLETEKPRRRRWRLWLVGASLVILGVTAGVSKLNTNKFSFLDRYHPVIVGPLPSADLPTNPDGKDYIYIFDAKEEKKIFSTLARELSGNGGEVQVAPDQSESAVIFTPPSSTDYVATYYPHKFAEVFFSPSMPTFKAPKGSCIVSVTRPATWLERQVDAVKKFLHWD